MRNRLIALLLCVCILLQPVMNPGSFVHAWETTGEAAGSEQDYSENVGKYATFNVAEIGYFFFCAVPEGDLISLAAEEIPADLTVVITDWYMDELEGIWYKIEAAPDNTLTEDMAQNPWVQDGYVGDEIWSLTKFDAPEDGFVPTELNQVTQQGIAVGVSGELPEGIALSVQDTEVDPAEYGIADAADILAALDIRLLNADGGDYQPFEDEKEVAVTIDAEKLGLSDGDIVRLYHNHQGTITVYDPYVVIGGKLTFWTNRFSTYIVEQVRVENYSQQITDGATYTMEIGQKVVFWGHEEGNRAVWRVDDTGHVINYNVIGKYDPGSGYAANWAQWIEIEAKNVGEATVSFVRYDGSTHTHPFTIKVVPPSGLYIQNQIPQNGCLVPAWPEDSTVDLSRVRYTWTRDDGQAIALEALRSDGGINVSIDRGGATNNDDGTVKTITYTLVATDLDGTKLGEFSYEVLYSNEILNPSFEKPGGFDWGYTTFYNGYPGLIWKTTAPGTGDKLAMDIELSHVGGNPYGILTAADGNFFVELNAEEFGTLYQDMLTTPGATLTWSFNHAKRQDSNGTYDSMYVIVAATDYAARIVDKDDIDALLDEALKKAEDTGTPIPTNDHTSETYSEGFEFTFTNDAGQTGTYRIWHSKVKYSSTASDQWKTISGTYQVPEGQYLTRLFFASDTNSEYSSNSTLGNMIDAVDAGEFMSYIVEYYKGDALQSAHTETGTNSAYEQVKLANLQTYLDTYQYPYEIRINGRPFPGTVANLKTGLLLTDYGAKQGEAADEQYADYGIVLQIVFRDPNIRVTKVVQIEGWEDMSPADRQALLNAGITAKFRLTNQADSEDIHETEVTIKQLSDTGELTSASSFPNISEADFGKLFTVTETYATPIENYGVTTTIDLETIGVNSAAGERIKNITVTNQYVRNVGNLTIKKDVVAPDGYTAPADDVFTFVVSGPAVTRSSYMVSVNNQAAVEYQVTDQKLTILLKAGEWAVIRNLDLKDYTVEENPKEHYALTSATGAIGTIVKDNTAHAGFVNTYLPTGSLKVSKFVDVGTNQHVAINGEQTFTFTLKLDKAPDLMDGPYSYTIRNHTDNSTAGTGTLTLDAENELTFTLKHNQYILIEDLPQSGYTLTEASAGEGYEAPYYYIDSAGPETVCSSEIPKGGTQEVACYNPADIVNGDLELTKLVACSNSDAVIPKQPFEFTVTLRNVPNQDTAITFQVEYSCDASRGTLSGNSYTLKGSDTAFSLPETVTACEDLGDYSFQLNLYDGLTATIKDIPPCGYTVTEKDYSADKFVNQWQGNTTGYIGGMIIDGKTPVASLTCVNMYDITTGEMNLTKTVKKESERDAVPDTEFVFTIEPAADSAIPLADGDYTVTIGETTAMATASGNKLVVKIPFTGEELSGMELNDSRSKTLNVKGLPFGNYVVTEQEDTDYVQSTTTQNAAVGSTPASVEFVNTYRQHLGQITIEKNVTGTSAADPVLVQITGGTVDMIVPVVPGTAVTVCDLPLNVAYTVTEIISWNWRYTPTGATVQRVTPTMDVPNWKVVFNNTYTNDQWRSSTDVQPNVFTKSTP